MKIENNASIGKLTESTHAEQVERARTDDAKSSDKRGDSSHVSALARQIGEARAVADQLPEVRVERVALARKRLAEGYYDSAEARETLVGRLANLIKNTK